MPIYSFRCSSCLQEEDLLVDIGTECAVCPACGGITERCFKPSNVSSPRSETDFKNLPDAKAWDHIVGTQADLIRSQEIPRQVAIKNEIVKNGGMSVYNLDSNLENNKVGYSKATKSQEAFLNKRKAIEPLVTKAFR